MIDLVINTFLTVVIITIVLFGSFSAYHDEWFNGFWLDDESHHNLIQFPLNATRGYSALASFLIWFQFGPELSGFWVIIGVIIGYFLTIYALIVIARNIGIEWFRWKSPK